MGFVELIYQFKDIIFVIESSCNFIFCEAAGDGLLIVARASTGLNYFLRRPNPIINEGLPVCCGGSPSQRARCR